MIRAWALAAATAAGACLAGAAHAEDGWKDPNQTFWSGVLLDVPVYTHHVPHDSQFNDQNWGLFVEYPLGPHLSLVGGDFKNSYNKNTAFAGIGVTAFHWKVSNVAVGVGGVLALDLNGGYRGFNQVDPLLGALTVRFSGAAPEDSPWKVFNHWGLLTTIIPPDPKGGSTAINVAISYRLK